VLCNMSKISRMTGFPLSFVMRKMMAGIRNRLREIFPVFERN